MAETATADSPTDVTSVLSGFERLIESFVSGFDKRVAALGEVGQNVADLHGALAAGGTSAGHLVMQILVVVAITAGVFIICRRWFERTRGSGWRTLFSTLAAAFIAIVAGVVAQRFLPADGAGVRTLRTWIVVTTACLLAIVAIQKLLTRHGLARRSRLPSLARDLSIAVGWSMFGVAFMATLRLWGAGEGLRDVFASLFIVLPAFLLFGWTVWRHRRTLSASVAGSKPRHRWRGWLARAWPGMVVGFLAVTFLTTEIARTLDVQLPGTTVLLSIVIVFLTPHLDALIANRANMALEGTRVSIVDVALRQTLRFAVLVVMLTMLGAVWASPLASGFGINLHAIASESFQVALIATGAAFLWNMLETAMARVAHGNGPAGHGAAIAGPAGMGPSSRLGTLVPLISKVGKSSILALALLTVLVSMGVNVWPLITGLSVFGLAIGFGSQTLVKDIVSGLFFLVDDAFRIGEYIETSGAKGTVEKISVRSVTLRNSRGPVATVPYGQISKVVNFSRDWAIEKIQFRLAFDTDVEAVRKIFKKIGQEMLADPELAPGIIEPFKSQGISNVEDGTLLVRGKFVARPGDVAAIRRAVLKAVHHEFRENGIRVVPKPLTGDPVAAAS